MQIELILSGLMIFSFTNGCQAEATTSGLVELVESYKALPDDPMYWFEVLNSFGEWEKTMLIFGYFGNEGACSFQLELAKKYPLFTDYRCVEVN